MKKILVTGFSLVLAAFMLAGCGGNAGSTPASGTGSTPASGAGSSSLVNIEDPELPLGGGVESNEEGVYEGKIGSVMHTYFFDFTVLSATAADSYADYTPEAGNKLVILEIETTNTFDEALPMFDTDYQLQWGERAENDDYAIVLDALDETCAPLDNELPEGESMTYKYIYEAPQDITAFEVCYLEEFEGDVDDGDIHFVRFTA